LLEAMKMELRLPAPTSGILAALDVKPGDTVDLHQVLGLVTAGGSEASSG
jgi:biotin carboxyl carrier protein